MPPRARANAAVIWRSSPRRLMNARNVTARSFRIGSARYAAPIMAARSSRRKANPASLHSRYRSLMKSAYVFPGQGAQSVGMGRDIYDAFPAAKDVFDEADRTVGFSLSSLCFDGPGDELTETINVQPALVTVRKLGIRSSPRPVSTA